MEKVITYSFGEDFIKNLSDYITANYLKDTPDLSRIAIVFGGKRPSLFLKRELSKKIKKGFYPPRFFSMDEFIEFLVRKKEDVLPLADLEACYFIYGIAKSCLPQLLKNRKEFSQFLPWAKEIGGFIEQLDLDDIADEKLKDIEENAEIGYEVPESINQLLQQIVILRKAYHCRLEEEKLYTRGFFYLKAMRNICEINLPEFDKILFCHLFSLHKTEKKIVKYFYDIDQAVLIFQRDQQHWPQLDKLADFLACRIEPEKQIEPKYNLNIYSGFDIHSQVGIVREVLKKIEHPEKSLIVLPDPENIIPLLSELTASVKEFNVSMGYPLKRSVLYSLFEAIIKAQKSKKEGSYYAPDYLKVISHPLVKNLNILAEPTVTRILVHKIEEILKGTVAAPLAGSLFVRLEDIEKCQELYFQAGDYLARVDIQLSQERLHKVLEELHHYCFSLWEEINSFNDFALAGEEFQEVLVKKSFFDMYPLNLKIMDKLFALFEEYQNLSFSQIKFIQEDIFKIFDDSLKNEKISFSGTPLKGLQILGLLETRSLSFENVIFMDVNESVLPKLQVQEPLIPRSVMVSLGLNRLEEEEEIQRYQFMRLVASARNVHLVYDDNPEKQRSRFIEELIWKKQKESGELEVVSIPRANFNVEVLSKQIGIKKTKPVAEFLNDFIFSASSINTYLNCPMQFYYQYVLGLKEKEDLLDEPEGREIGIFIHELLEQVFVRFMGKKPVIDDSFKKKFFAEFNKKFEETLAKRRKSDAFMLNAIMQQRLERFLGYETQRNIEEIIGLEQTLKKQIKFSGRSPVFECRIDRIDKLEDGSILIIDYKTGSTDTPPKGIKILEKMELNRESIRQAVCSFQLPLYLYLLQEKYEEKKISAALYNLKTIELDYFPKQKEDNVQEKIMQKCLQALEFIVSEIQDPERPFEATQDKEDRCEYCPFFYLCR